MFVLGGEVEAGIDGTSADAAILLRQELHGVVDAFEIASGDGQVAWLLGADGDDDGVEIGEEFRRFDIDSDVYAGAEGNALGFHLLYAAFDVVLLHLEIGNTEDEQAAGDFILLEDGDGMAGAVELLRGGESGGTGADDGDFLASAGGGRFGADPGFFPAAVGDGLFDAFDGDWVVVDTEDAGGLARRGADASGDFGEVIGGVELAQGVLPAAVIDEVVPVGNDVVERATGVAERDAAVHATRALCFEDRLIGGEVDLAVVVNALIDRTAFKALAGVLFETGYFTHLRLFVSGR